MTLLHRGPLGLKQPKAAKTVLRKSAAGERCSLRLDCCNHNPETTVLAHLRFFGWAGIGEKPHDLLAVFACSSCHDAIDRRSNDLWGYEDLLRGMGETILRQVSKGLITIKGAK